MRATVRILGEDYAIECADCDERRLADLAATLEARLQRFSGDAGAMRRLVLTALGLMDEVQAQSAALVRARNQIERLTDLVVEAKLEAAAQDLTAEEPEAPDRAASMRCALPKAELEANAPPH